MRLVALRGANTVTENSAEAILAATEELMREILERNALGAEDLVSCIFTLTPDLDAEFPAVAAREMGLRRCRCCARGRSRCPGALPQVIRVMIHCLRGPARAASTCTSASAVKLRLDLAGAQ